MVATAEETSAVQAIADQLESTGWTVPRRGRADTGDRGDRNGGGNTDDTAVTLVLESGEDTLEIDVQAFAGSVYATAWATPSYICSTD